MKTVLELINELRQFPEDMLVQICDIEKVAAAGEPTHDGIYDFTVELMGEDFIPEGTKPWLALHFNNEDID